MNVLDELKANNKCETCRDVDICGIYHRLELTRYSLNQLEKTGIKAIAIVYECKHYKKR